ncbi:MAG: hypothetical protein GY809_22795 [Planctomycetes bacterium]|nr:hypothetical protein [Planctomycetota bacterium]
MPTSNKEKARVTLPGRMFQKAGRWWWSVQLPGEARCRARALRGPEERFATSDRRTAEAAALNLWQEAIVAEVMAQFAEKSRAYTFLIDHMTEAPKSSYRQAPWTAPSQFQVQAVSGTEFMACASIEKLPSCPASPTAKVTRLREPDAGTESSLDVMEFLSERASLEDRQGCECCGSKDFFDEYLQTVEAGQKLCPRCVQAMREDIRVGTTEDVIAV